MVDWVLEHFFILFGRAHLSQYFVFHFECRFIKFSTFPTKILGPLLFFPPIWVTCTNLHFTFEPILNNVLILKFVIEWHPTLCTYLAWIEDTCQRILFLPYYAEDNNIWRYTFTPFYAFVACCFNMHRIILSSFVSMPLHLLFLQSWDMFHILRSVGKHTRILRLLNLSLFLCDSEESITRSELLFSCYSRSVFVRASASKRFLVTYFQIINCLPFYRDPISDSVLCRIYNFIYSCIYTIRLIEVFSRDYVWYLSYQVWQCEQHLPHSDI